MKLPEMVRVVQKFESPVERDIPAAVQREMRGLDLGKRVRPGQSVALTAGSRGIANIALILRETVRYFKSLDAKPFIVPTMGSHGGGTAAGQRKIIESYGVTEEFVEAPIRSQLEVVELGKNEFGVPVYLDKAAAAADHIGVVGRVKPHTNFEGAIESGLCKMMLIGLGKHVGATVYHRELLRYPWEPFARSSAQVMLSKAPVLFGMGIVENARDETGRIKAALASDVIRVEEELLVLAKKWMPRLPFADADLLIIDEMGKDISGSGMDTNIIGRKSEVKPASGAYIHRIYVRGLTEKTHGNAAGIGLADFTTDRLVNEMDYEATIINCLTSNHPQAAATPCHFSSDMRAIDYGLKTAGLEEFSRAKIQHIKNTLQITELLVSTGYDLSQAETPIEVIGREEYEFDATGNLPHHVVMPALAHAMH